MASSTSPISARLLRRIAGILLALGVLALAGLALWSMLLDNYGRAWRHAPEDARWLLPDAARALAASAFVDADDGPADDKPAQKKSSTTRPVTDGQVDILSRGQLSGADFVNHSHSHGASAPPPLAWLGNHLRRSASGISDDKSADAEYVSRLLRQIRAMPGAYRARIFARDAVFLPGGRRDTTASPTVIDNNYVLWLAGQAEKRLIPVASVHPDRRDAAVRLQQLADRGVRDISWLPIAQRIDLGSAAARALYPIMAASQMTLHVPVGWHETRDNNGRQGWIDPQMLQPALAAGVHVELSLAGPAGRHGQRLMPALWALLAQPRDARLITVDLAGILAGDRLYSELLPLLQHPQFYSRLAYGSGYPDSAVPGQVDIDGLVAGGFLPAAIVADLRAIYDVNPLLFTLVVMRNVVLPHTHLHLPAAVFLAPASAASGAGS